MIGFAAMLVSYAKAGGIKVPSDPENYDKNKFPHWHVYVCMQLGASIPYSSALVENARIIANLSNKKINKVTYQDLKSLGFNDENSHSYA